MVCAHAGPHRRHPRRRYGHPVPPATKAVPKELLPIGDTPALQLIIDEALGAGIDHIVVVSSRNKPAIEAYFEPAPEVLAKLEAQRQDRRSPSGSQHRVATGGRRSSTRTSRAASATPSAAPRGGRRRAVRRAAARRADGRLVAARPDERGLREHRRQRRRRSSEVPREEVSSLRRDRPGRTGRRRRRGRRRATGREAAGRRGAERPDHHRPLRADARRVRRDRRRLQAGRGGEIQLTDALRAQAARSPFHGVRQQRRPLRHRHAARLPDGGDRARPRAIPTTAPSCEVFVDDAAGPHATDAQPTSRRKRPGLVERRSAVLVDVELDRRRAGDASVARQRRSSSALVARDRPSRRRASRRRR